MDLSKLNLFQAIGRKMGWLTERQQVIAQNVANANTPNYRAMEISPFTFQQTMSASLAPVQTSAMHLTGGRANPKTGKVEPEKKPWEVTPSSNGVVIEDQMMKSAESATDYQLITNLYRKNLGMIRLALGRGGSNGNA